MTPADRLALQDDLHAIAATLRGVAASSSDIAPCVERLIAAGYAPTSLRVIERVARELAEHEEQP